MSAFFMSCINGDKSSSSGSGSTTCSNNSGSSSRVWVPRVMFSGWSVSSSWSLKKLKDLLDKINILRR